MGGLSAGFPLCVRFRRISTGFSSLPRPGQWIFSPKHLFCILLGPLPASSQGDRGTGQSYHLFKNSPFPEICVTLST